MHHSSQIIDIFNGCFKDDLQTELVCGGQEPIYIPRSQYYPWDRVIFAHGFYASALHEISHWCIAGKERRKLVDFGYWYTPDGRTEEQQALFESVEIKPQALEWILCVSAGFKFNVSIDNLNAQLTPDAQAADQFKQNIIKQVEKYLEQDLPERANILSKTLIEYYRNGKPLQTSEFKRENI